MAKRGKISFEDIAVAVKYAFGAGGEAPKVVASGRGLIAARIIEEARKHKIPLREDKALADSLAKIPVGLEIPPELWEAVAEVLAQIYRLDGNRTNG